MRASAPGERLWVRGRVLDDEGLRPAAPGSSAWRNLRDAWRRFETDERPGVRVRAMFQGHARETLTDREGFFEIVLEPAEPPPEDRSWHEVDLAAPARQGAATPGHRDRPRARPLGRAHAWP